MLVCLLHHRDLTSMIEGAILRVGGGLDGVQEFSHYKVKYNTTFPTTFGQHSYYLQLGGRNESGKGFLPFSIIISISSTQNWQFYSTSQDVVQEAVSKVFTNHIDDEEEHGEPKLLILIIYIIVSMRAEVGAIQSSRKLSQNFPFTLIPLLIRASAPFM